MSKSEKKPSDDWKLQKIELEFKTWGEYEGKYAGTIRFQNGDYESFQFKLRPDMAQPYIDLLADDIVKAATILGERLLVSLGLAEQSEEASP